MVINGRLFLAILLCSLLAGCAQVYVPVSESKSPPSNSPSTFPPPETQAPPASPPVATESEPAKRIEPTTSSAPVKGNSAVASLLDEAWRLNRAREYDRSNAVAERAMRIDHAEPEVYLVMATNYVAMTQLQLAEQLVRQGLPLAGRQPGVKSQLQSLLVKIQSKY